MGSRMAALLPSLLLIKSVAEWTPPKISLLKTSAFEWSSHEQPTTIPPQTGRWCCGTAVRVQSQYVCIISDGDNTQAETGGDVQPEWNSAMGFLAR